MISAYETMIKVEICQSCARIGTSSSFSEEPNRGKTIICLCWSQRNSLSLSCFQLLLFISLITIRSSNYDKYQCKTNDDSKHYNLTIVRFFFLYRLFHRAHCWWEVRKLLREMQNTALPESLQLEDLSCVTSISQRNDLAS